MDKINLGIVFGGMSTENEVSVKSAKSILANINREKYNIYSIYITKEGVWKDYDKDEVIFNVFSFLKQLDVVFPVLHGLYGEDGTIQGLFELVKVPYVGCNVLASSVGMDKVYTKIIFEKAGLKQAKYAYIRSWKDEYIYVSDNFEEEYLNLEKVANKITSNMKFPMFIKPSNSGSSIGINKATNIDELKLHIEYAKQFDNKIIIEENINGRELECSVLGNEDVMVSIIGEILPGEDFYSFNAKYNDNNSKTEFPTDIPTDIEEEIKRQAVKAFKAISGSGLSRVDFFLEDQTNEIFINEINTLPGFTNISMYPKLLEKTGISYSELIDKAIELAIK